jgi:hypothetical protein
MTATKRRRWHTASGKRQPPFMKSVLVRLSRPWCESGDTVTIGWRIDRGRWCVLTPEGSESRAVTHWASVPAQPRAGK